jgi:hypothetical protein
MQVVRRVCAFFGQDVKRMQILTGRNPCQKKFTRGIFHGSTATAAGALAAACVPAWLARRARLRAGSFPCFAFFLGSCVFFKNYQFVIKVSMQGNH